MDNNIFRESQVDYSIPAMDVEITRPYSPEVIRWRLSGVARSRLDEGELPINLPANAYRLIDYIDKLDMAEEDEISNELNISLNETRALIERLRGYGYIEQAS